MVKSLSKTTFLRRIRAQLEDKTWILFFQSLNLVIPYLIWRWLIRSWLRMVQLLYGASRHFYSIFHRSWWLIWDSRGIRWLPGCFRLAIVQEKWAQDHLQNHIAKYKRQENPIVVSEALGKLLSTFLVSLIGVTVELYNSSLEIRLEEPDPCQE